MGPFAGLVNLSAARDPPTLIRNPDMIAFYGMGLLGSNFVRALLERGETVHVWNRTDGAARALEADGAVCFEDPAEAARGAARVHLTLSDDDAVDAVLERARAGFDDQVVLVDHTTTSRTGTAERVRRWTADGIAFQHAPVFMGPANARQGTGGCSLREIGPASTALEPELAKMTGKVVYLGPEPDRAAAFKLMGNLFLMAMTTGLVEMLSLAKAMGVEADGGGLALRLAELRRLRARPRSAASWRRTSPTRRGSSPWPARTPGS